MFNMCSNLTSLNLDGFKTNEVTRMDGMFEDGTGLTS